MPMTLSTYLPQDLDGLSTTSCAASRPSGRRSNSTSCEPASTGGSTAWGTRISTTRAEACTRSRSSGAITPSSASRCWATRIRATPPQRPRPPWSIGPARPYAASSTPPTMSTRSSSPPTPPARLRLVGEAYPFRRGGVYLLSYDNHNSVNGIREFAHRKGAAVVYVPVHEERSASRRGAPLQRAGCGAIRGRASLRLPCAVQLQRGAASAGVGLSRAGPGMGRAARLRRLRAHQPARSGHGEARLRSGLLLQAVRLPHRGRRADRPARQARRAAEALVRRRHDRRRLGAGTGLVPADAGGRGVRRRHRSITSGCRRCPSGSSTSKPSASTSSIGACGP